MLHCLAKLEEVAGACVIRQSVDGIAFFSLSHLQLLNLEKKIAHILLELQKLEKPAKICRIFSPQPAKILRPPT